MINVDPGQLSAIVEGVLTALRRVLFLEGRFVDLPVFARHMLGQLQKNGASNQLPRNRPARFEAQEPSPAMSLSAA